MRRIVTGEIDGRSQVLHDGPGAQTPHWDELWVTSPSDPLGRDPADPELTLEPPKGGTGWRIYSVPPDAVMRQVLDQQSNNEITDSEGFHKTRTLDYVYVLDGNITLQLEEESVLLRPGDCVVQRGTNHAWRNHNDVPVRLLTVMVALP